MPTIAPGSKVLVTGSNGYIPLWVVLKLLEDGFSVRGTVRSASKGEYMKSIYKSFGDKFEYVVVPDITADGAFDEAVKGVDGIEHMASPVNPDVVDPQELIGPAVSGTLALLNSALKNGSQVKRIVVTSSFVAVINFTVSPLSEEHWNDAALVQVEEKGKDAAPFTKYSASKVLAERAAWDFYEKHKSEIQWDLTVLNPPYVYGPFLQEVSDPQSLNDSMKMWYNFAMSDTPKDPRVLGTPGAWVDVRDLADAHVLALKKEAAGGHRIIVTQGPVVPQEWVEIANKLAPVSYPGRTLSKGFPETKIFYPLNLDTSKQAKILGINFRSKEETTKDILTQLAERGW